MFEFTTSGIELELLDRCPDLVNIHPDKQFYTTREKITLVWSAEFEMREWGIKDIFVSVPDQAIEFETEIWSDGDDDITSETVTARIFNVEADLTGRGDSVLLCPRLLEFYKGKWTLHFGV